MCSDGGIPGTPTPTGPGPDSLAKGTARSSEPGLATTGSGPGLARPAGSTPAARHPCKRVKELGRASRALEKAREVEARAKEEESPRNRVQRLPSQAAPAAPPPAAAATQAAPKQPAAGPPRAPPAADGRHTLARGPSAEGSAQAEAEGHAGGGEG